LNAFKTSVDQIPAFIALAFDRVAISRVGGLKLGHPGSFGAPGALFLWRYSMNLIWILIVVLVVVALIGLPGLGPWHHSYGYYPSGLGGLLVIVLLVLLLSGRL
jgi:hypothetical protein